MITQEGCRGRRERLWKMVNGRCDLAIFTRPEALTYFTGFVLDPFEFRSNEAGAVLLLTPEKATLLGDNVIKGALSRAFADEVLAPTWYDGKHAATDRRENLVEHAAQTKSHISAGMIGLDTPTVPIGLVERILVPNSAWFDLGPTFATLRRAKDPDEVACIERSLRAMEHATAMLRRELAPGKTELDAFTICQRAAAESLQAPAAVYGDFVAGPTIDRRGGPPSTRVIQAGELFLLDFSVVVQGYRGDFATTWAVGGDPSAEAQRLHKICLDALDAGEAVLNPGVKGREVDAAVRAVVQREGLEANSPSHTGHGLGLGHPEAPYLVRDSEDVLVAGDIVTLEPSLFVAGVAGMRVEHNYRITPEGFERLSQHNLSLTA